MLQKSNVDHERLLQTNDYQYSRLLLHIQDARSCEQLVRVKRKVKTLGF